MPVVLAPAVPAAAQTSGAGELTSTGTENVLTIRNTGSDELRCMRFTAAQGVQITGASGPGQTQVESSSTFASQNHSIPPGQSQQWTFTTAQPYPTDGGGTLRISANCAIDFGAPVTGPAAQPPPGPQPVEGRQEVLEVLSGVILIRLRGQRDFVRLRETTAIPNGTEVDATNGAVRITVSNGRGGTESADVSEGRFVVTQNRARPPVTTLRLSEPLSCPRTSRARAAQRRRKKSRKIFVRTQGGNFKTKGRYAEAIARGTAWRTTDECTRTIVSVFEGRVQVTSRAGRVTVGAGRRVVTQARRRPR